jgi:N-acetylneuraminic acid mutarotase
MYKQTYYILLFLLLANPFMCKYQDNTDQLTWEQWPSVPDTIGFAGAFVGVAGQQLVAAGGANFPGGGAPWTGAKKAWTDKVFALADKAQTWKLIGHLPKPLGYGVAVNWKNSMILVGGSNEMGHSNEVYQLTVANDSLQIKPLPSLPHPVANNCGAVVGDKLYVLGGIQHADSKEAANTFWCLDLADQKKGWEVLPTWPGQSRMLAVAGTDGENLYLFSGVALENGNRKYLKDAYRYSPNEGWKALADLSTSVAAAPSPALYEDGQLLICGGDDGTLAAKAAELKEKHPGFSNAVYAYNPLLNKWQVRGQVITKKQNDFVENPNHSVVPPVTTGATVWKGFYVIPQGEVRPATRTINVIALKID